MARMQSLARRKRRLALAVATAAPAVLAAPAAATPGRAVHLSYFVRIKITNSTPSPLRLTESQLDRSKFCWSDDKGDCVDQPPTETDPGDTATVYIARAYGGLPEVIGNVKYSVTDNSVGSSCRA